MMKKKKRKKLYTENMKLKAIASEGADRLRGLEKHLPPTKEIPVFRDTNEDRHVIHNDFSNEFVKQPLVFTDRFIDNSLAICFCGCLTCFGFILRGLI